MTDDFYAEFKTFSDEDAPEYKFENVGDTIRGVLMHRAIVDTKFGRKLKYVLETDDGLRTLWCGQAQLAAKLAQLEPAVGDKVGIRWTGEEPSNKGNPLKTFQVKAEKVAPEPAPSDGWDGSDAI